MANDDDTSPVRCLVLPGHRPIADEFADALGITVHAASLIVDTNLIRGDQ